MHGSVSELIDRGTFLRDLERKEDMRINYRSEEFYCWKEQRFQLQTFMQKFLLQIMTKACRIGSWTNWNVMYKKQRKITRIKTFIAYILCSYESLDMFKSISLSYVITCCPFSSVIPFAKYFFKILLKSLLFWHCLVLRIMLFCLYDIRVSTYSPK